MRDFLASLMRSLLRDLALVGVATVLLGTGLALLAPLAPTEAFAGALVACVGLWLLVRFFLNSGEF